MEEYKEDFANFLLSNDVLKIGGPFKLKSGRQSPYFVNTGVLADGEGIGMLGFYYASKINDKFGASYDVIFGPAYKGIPLAVAAAENLASGFDSNKRILFDRKLPKKHGEATTTKDFARNWLIGKIQDGARVLIIDDVFTTGKTKYDSIELLDKCASNLTFVGMIISVDRQEIGDRKTSAIEDFVEKTGISVEPIISITEIVECLGDRLSDSNKENMKKYLEKFGTIEAKRSVEKWK